MTQFLQHLFVLLFKYPPRVFSRGALVFTPVVPRFMLVLLAVAGAVAAILAVRALRGVSRADQVMIGLLRGGVFAVIVLCLSRPALAVTVSVPQRNVLAVLLDDSRSMTIRDADTASRLSLARRLFADSTVLVHRLADRFALRFFRFSGTATPLSAVTDLRGAGLTTDLAASLDAARQSLADAPLAGAVVVSDGADNGESNLDRILLDFRSRGIPVYTVGVGGERLAHDVAIDHLDVPATTLQGSGALATATLTVRGAAGDATILTAESDGQIVASDTLVLPRDRDAIDVPIRIPPQRAGLHRIHVHVTPIRGELVTGNNDAGALLRVRPAIERVLYVEGEPRYEFSFVRRAFEDDSAVRLVALLRSASGKFLRLNVADSLDLLGGFPTRPEDLFRYRALIVGDVEATFFTGTQMRMIADFVDRRGGALLMLGGHETLAEGGYRDTPVADVLPVALDGPAHDTAVVSLKVTPTSNGLRNPALTLGPTDAVSRARWDSLPDVTAVNRLGALRPGAVVLLAGRSPATPDSTPVLVTQRYGRGIASVLGVQDTWLWQMNPRAPLDDHTFRDFWRQWIRWTLDQVPDQVTASATPERVVPGGSVELIARVNDSLFHDDNIATVTARVTAPDGSETTVPMPWTLRQDGSYAAQVPVPLDGRYQFDITAVTGSDTLHAATSGFLADSSGADMQQPEARPGLLRRIAERTGGRFYRANAAATLPDDAIYTASGIVAHETRDLWDMPAILLVTLLLLAADWGWRRRRGLA